MCLKRVIFGVRDVGTVKRERALLSNQPILLQMCDFCETLLFWTSQYFIKLLEISTYEHK